MIELKNIYKTYKSKQGVTFRALEDINLKFASKGMVFILGKSGSGKSTLLNLIGALDSYDRGDIIVDGESLSGFTPNRVDAYRSSYLGFVFQDYNLMRNLNVFDNIKLALNVVDKKNTNKVIDILKSLSIEDLKDRKVHELSGGEKQRVAIARALIKNPNVILADEPSGSLDTKNTTEVFSILKDLSKDKLVIIVSHDRELAKQFGDRIIEIADGQIYKDLDTTTIASNQKEQVSIIASSIVKIEGKAQLKEEELNNLNKIIKKDKRETFLFFETDKNKVKSMYPHLKETIDQENSQKEVFKQYKFNEEEKKEYIEKKFNLSFLDSLKIGFKTLINKKLGLILLLLITTISLTLFGFSDDIASFKVNDGISISLKKETKGFVTISDNNYRSDRKEKIDMRSINEVKSLLPDFAYLESYEYDFNTNLEKPLPNLVDKFTGFIEVDYATSLGLSYLSLSDDALFNHDNIIISKLMADALSYAEFAGYNVYETFLNKKIMLNDYEYTIGGVFDCDCDGYGTIINNQEEGDYQLAEQLDFEQDQYLSKIIVKRGFKNHLSNNETYLSRLKLNIIDKVSFDLSIYKESVDFSEDHLIKFEERPLLENEYYVSPEVFWYFMDSDPLPQELIRDINFYQTNNQLVEDLINDFNSMPNRQYYFDNDQNVVSFGGDNFKIMGIIFNDNPGVMITIDETISAIVSDNISFSKMFVKSKYFTTNTNKKVEILSNSGLKVNELYYAIYEDFYTLKDVFVSALKTLSLILAAIVVLLFYNFIKSSIKSSQKQIGLLRALGSKKSDIIKIYALESLIIGLVSIFLAIVIYLVGGNIVNTLYSSSYSRTGNYNLGIFSFKFVSLMKMSALMIGVIIVSITMPFIKLLKLTPIEAINDK